MTGRHRGQKQSFRLVTECSHYNGVLSAVSHIFAYWMSLTVMHVIFFIVECGIAHFLCAIHVFKLWASSSSSGYLCAKCRFFCGLHCWASRWRKIVYSVTQSITHPAAYLMPREPKLSLRNNPTTFDIHHLPTLRVILVEAIKCTLCDRRRLTPTSPDRYQLACSDGKHPMGQYSGKGVESFGANRRLCYVQCCMHWRLTQYSLCKRYQLAFITACSHA